MTNEALYLHLASRRSVRRFRPDEVPRATLRRVLEAAILAPSASNQQPWRFLVVTSPARRRVMADAVRAVIDQIAARIPEESQPAFRAYGEYFTRFEHAPVVIAPLARGLPLLGHLIDEHTPADLRAAVAHVERHSGVVGTSLALQNLLLAAHAEGLGASAMTGPLLAEAALRPALAIPPSWTLVALVPMGFPDEAPTRTERKRLDHVVRFLDAEGEGDER